MGILHSLEPFLTRLPEVQRPQVPLTFKDKLKWTLLILLSYFLLANTNLYGLDHDTVVNFFKAYQTITASKLGTLMSLGIGPIVTGSIILQIMVGGKLIDLDLTNPRDKAIYQGTQRTLAMAFTIFEAAAMVLLGALPAQDGNLVLQLGIITQLTFAGLLIIFMDEVVSKWGFGSGIGLFIAAGVSEEIIWRMFNPYIHEAKEGNLFLFVDTLAKGDPNFAGLIPIVGLILTFMFVVYMESVRVEIPITYGRYRGGRGRYPIKFIYASVIPVIFASILMANVQLWATMLEKIGHPILGNSGSFGDAAPTGIVKFFTIPFPIYSGSFDPLHTLIYTAMLVTLAVLFSVFWVSTTNMDAKSVAKQLHQGGMQIPGFRGDIRIIERVLDKYIPVVTVLGGATVGLLAAFGDITGAMGGGTGVLLTVGILYKMYEQMAKEQLMEIHPMLKKVVGDIF